MRYVVYHMECSYTEGNLLGSLRQDLEENAIAAELMLLAGYRQVTSLLSHWSIIALLDP